MRRSAHHGGLDLLTEIRFLRSEGERPLVGTARHKTKATEAESRVTVAAYYLLLCVAGVWAASHPVSSGDLCVALGCGRYTLPHGVVRTDPFAFTSIPGTWVNQNWLSHILFTWIERFAGLTGLGIWKIAVCVAISLLTASTSRALGASRLLAAIAGIAVAVAGRPFHDVRPNMHSILLAAILVRWLVRYENRTLVRSWPIVVLMIAWANLHGGFLFGFLALGAATFGLILIRLRRGARSRVQWSILLLPLICIVAAVISPHGLTNLTHPYEVSMGPAAEHWRGVSEWKPPYVQELLGEPGIRAFWALLLVGAVILLVALLRRRKMAGTIEHLPVAAVALLALFLAATSRRFIPLLAITSIPPLAMTAGRIVRPYRLPSVAWIIAAVLAVTAAGLDIAERLFLSNAIWPHSQGWAARLVRADEQPVDAVRFVLTSNARGRLLTNWTWGGYLLQSIPFEDGEPRYQIYIDGRAQAAYPVTVSEDHVAVTGAAAARDVESVEGFLNHYKIDICVLGRMRRGLGWIVPELSDWVAVYGDDRSVVAVRKETVGTLVTGAFPDDAIAHASAALHLRSRGSLTLEEMLAAFQHAVTSVRTRPTTTGVTEMVRLALGAKDQLGESFRAQATAECDRILDGGIQYDILYERVAIDANTAQCRAALAAAAGDKETARMLRARALEGSARAEAIFRRQFR